MIWVEWGRRTAFLAVFGTGVDEALAVAVGDARFDCHGCRAGVGGRGQGAAACGVALGWRMGGEGRGGGGVCMRE